MMTTKDRIPEREEIEALLPWHAAGTLSGRDTARVERALASDRELARRYELVREELAETIHLNETLGAPSARALEKLFARIDAEAPRRERAPLALGARLAEFVASFSPRTLAWSAVAAALAIVLQAGVITGVLLGERGAPGYQTASAPAERAEQGAFVRVRFNPQASAADITRFLEANKATIVGGPTEAGMFRVKVAAAPLPADELARIARRFSEDRAVGIAAAE
jgi:anti-sigma-K factor RskA